MLIIRFLFCFFVIIFSEYIFSQNFKEIFNKNITIEKNIMDAKKFFDLLSKKTGIDFIFSSKVPIEINVDEYKNKSLKILLRNLEEGPGFMFILKFEKENVYIFVESPKFLETEKEINNTNLIDIELKDGSMKDILSTIENFSNKKFIIKNEEILSKKITIKCNKKKWEDLLEELSNLANFSYKIAEDKIIIE